MPKSKRQKLVSLTKTQKKGAQLKEKLVQELRECADKYNSIYIFHVENTRNTKLKEMRRIWGESRFFFGKNKVMAHALGRNPEEEHKANLHKLARRIEGDCGLLFTDSSKEEVIKFFDGFSESNYARSGCVAPRDFNLDKGPLSTIPFSMETHLRSLGLKTLLKNGVVQLLADTQVCRKGDVLTPEQCKLLEIFEQEMAEFHVVLDCCWSGDGEFEIFEHEEVEEGDSTMKE